MLNWWGPTSNLKLPFFDSSHTNNHLYIIYQSTMEMLTYFHSMSLNKNNVAVWFLVLPINIENLCRLSRGGYIYYIYYIIYISIWSSWHHIFAVPPPPTVYRNLGKFTGWAIIEELSIRRRVHTFLISWGQKTCEKQLCWFIVVLWVLVCKNMYQYERHFGSFHQYSSLLVFPIAQSNLPKLAVGAAQRLHSWNAYLTSMFGHYIGGYIIN